MGGIADDDRMPDAPTDVPPHWLTWFAVAGPAGEAFGIITVAAA